MDINDEVRFRVSPDIIGTNNGHIKRYDKNSAKKPSQRIKVKSKKPEKQSRSKGSKNVTNGYRFQAVVNAEGLIELDLSHRKLRIIPEEVLTLVRLEVLNISHNEFKSFPSQLSLLRRLKRLDGSWNAIVALPETFTNLKHLKELDLSHNALQTLPTNIHCLVHLHTLNLAYNRLEHLPNQTGFLSALRHLSLSGNQLWNLPKTFSKLGKLKRLNISSNAFDQLPVVLCDLRDLELLDLHDNNMFNLPAEFEKFQKLKELNLSGNQLEAVPYILCQIRQLRSLNLSNNRIVGIPPRLYKVTKLKLLNLQKNLLKSLPMLPTVEYLNVAENRLQNLSLSKSKCLKHLNANGNHLDDMPLGIYNQRHLEVLKLSRNRVGYVSQDIVLLQKLRCLDLSHNQLRSLPQVIHELEKLQAFNIEGNQIERRGRRGQGLDNSGPEIPGVPNMLYYNKGTLGLLQRSRSMDRIQERGGYRRSGGSHYGSDSHINYHDFEDTSPPRHYKGKIDNGKLTSGHEIKHNYKRESEARKESKNKPWFKWGRKEKQVRQSWPQMKTFGTQYTPVSQQNTRSERGHSSKQVKQGASEVENYLQSNTLPVSRSTPNHSNKHHKSVVEIDYPLNVVDGNPYMEELTTRPKTLSHSANYNHASGSYRPNGDFAGHGRLREPSYSTIAMVSTHNEDIGSDVSSVAAATVAEWETVGDELSLGEEDYEYQPTSVKDKRLRGVARDVERLLNRQLLQPVSRTQHGRVDNWPVQSLRKYPTIPPHYDHVSEDEGSWFSVPETRTSRHTEPLNRLVPRKNDIIMKNRFQGDRNRVNVSRKSTVTFRVTPGGGTFHSDRDTNIKVHFPVGAVDFPVDCKLQVSPLHEDVVKRARFHHHSRLSHLVAMGPLVTLSSAEGITLNTPVSLTLPEPVSEASGYLHILNYHRDATCTPCTAKQTRHHGYVTIDVWNFAGKCTVLTKSRDAVKSSALVEHLLQLINFQ